MLYFLNMLFTECSSAVMISLENEDLVSKGSFAGRYEVSAQVNGSPSYTMGEKAIWKLKVGFNYWNIGSTSELKLNNGFWPNAGLISSVTLSRFGGLTEFNWFHSENSTQQVKNIDVQCTL